MKKYSIFIVLIAVIISSCVKDRLQPTAAPVKVSTSDTLMYFWSFNAGDSSNRSPDSSVNSAATYKYYCNYIDFTGGSIVNLHGTDTGQCLRLRNPSDSVIFYMPTTGYDSVYVQFAEEATSSGPSQNAIYYTTDGVNYIATALGNNSFEVGTTFGLNNFSFAADKNTNNNPKFAIKIVFLNNNTGTTGNDRIDNMSMMGIKK